MLRSRPAHAPPAPLAFDRPHPAGAPFHAAELTARELQVMEWLAAGKTDRDIGEILGISRRTVHKHLQRIYEKLGVETRTAAVMRLFSMRV